MTQAIFLSYASQDADAARRICESLRAAGLEVWFDQSELRGGDAWDQSIRKQIKECALFVPIITPNTQAREEGYFRLEWKLAVDRSHLMADNKAFFVPVLIGDVSEPAALVPDKFRERQWSRLDDDATIVAFSERVAKLLTGSASQGKSAPEASPMLVSAVPTVPLKKDDTPSIAVLAFANRSASADDEYFSDGLADELLNVLAKIKDLRVAARTSAFSFKGKQTTVEEIGRTLNVATVLEGSVRKSGNRVRISVQLVKAHDGFHLWSETYDRTLEDIFAVQDDIAQLVVTQLRSTLLGESRSDTAGIIADVAGAAKDRSDNAEAQRLYLQGRYLLARKSEQDLLRSVQLFEGAVALDADFALGWAWLAQAYNDVGGWGAGWQDGLIHDAHRKALTAVEKALSLAPDLVQAHLSMAYIQMGYAWDWPRADAAIQRALELAPDSADALTAAMKLAFCLRRFDEAETYGTRAFALDPLNAACARMLAIVLFGAGKVVAAEAAIRQSLVLSPDAIASRHALALILSALGRHEEALAEARIERAEWAQLTALAVIHWGMNTEASRRESVRLLATLIEKHAAHSAIQIAHVHATHGDIDQAFEWIARAYRQRDAGLAYTNAVPFLDPLRGDARWKPMLRKLGFEA